MTTITPKPGFHMSRLAWGKPDDPLSFTCSYCAAPIPEDSVPLRLFKQDGSAAVLCDSCSGDGFGVTLAEPRR